VAATGSYDDLTDKPTIPTVPSFGDIAESAEIDAKINDARFTPFCGYAFDGGGATALVDVSRTEDDEGWFVPADPDALTVAGQTMPPTGVAVVAVRNQPGGAPTGFFEWGHIGESIDGEVVSADSFADPKPETGDAILKRTIQLNGRWTDPYIFGGSKVDIGELSRQWEIVGDGLSCDFADEVASYVPATPAHWAGDPADAWEALDRLAAALYASTTNTPIP
jgi:hypothetical protein